MMNEDFWTISPQEAIKVLLSSGQTQRQIAAACNVSQATISYIHTGRDPEPSYLIVDALRVEVAKLVPTLTERVNPDHFADANKMVERTGVRDEI